MDMRREGRALRFNISASALPLRWEHIYVVERGAKMEYDLGGMRLISELYKLLNVEQ